MPKSKSVKRAEALQRIEVEILGNARLLSHNLFARWGIFDLQRNISEANKIRHAANKPYLHLDLPQLENGKVIVWEIAPGNIQTKFIELGD